MATSSSGQKDEYSLLKSVIRSLLVSNPTKCTLQRLGKDYREMEGTNIPYRRLGYNSLEELLYSMPDTVKLFGSGAFAEVAVVQSEKSTHISHMIAQQRPSKGKKGPRQRYIPPQCSNVRSQQQRNAPRSLSGFNGQSRNQRPNRPPSSLNFEPEFENRNFSDQKSSNNTHQTPQTPVPLNSKPYILADLISESEEDEDADVYSSPSPPVVSSTVEYRSKVPVDVQNRLRKLIQEHPAGIFCSKLPTIYSEKYGDRLRYDKYGYRSVIAMCSDLPEIFHYTQPSSDDFLIVDRNVPLPEPIKNETQTELPNGQVEVTGSILNEIDLRWNLGSIVIPDDVLHLGKHVPRSFLKHELVPGAILSICIGEYYDPSKFWVQMEKETLTTLMSQLNDFFNAQSNKYAIPEVLILEGLYCVTLFSEEFHRAVIVNTLPRFPGHVKVLFIDYGTVGWVQSSQVYYLPKIFAEKPCQAIRARLSSIAPPFQGHPWSTEAINCFRNLYKNAELMAEIIHIDREDKIVEFYVANVSDEDDVYYLNDELVDQGHAVYTDQTRTSPLIDDPNSKCLVRNFHLCPSFEEIEGGCAPMLEEVNALIELKVSINHVFPQYFSTTYHDDIYYHECRHERINEKHKTIPPPPQDFPSNDFDYSIFPEDLVSEIHSLISGKKEDLSKVVETLNANSFSGLTNRKRISDLLKSASDSADSSSLTSSLSDRKDDSLTSTPSPMLEMPEKPSVSSSIFKNPFLNSTPWKSTNPFASELSPIAPEILPTKPALESELKKLNPFASSWSHKCAKSEKAVQVDDFQFKPLAAVPVAPLPVPVAPLTVPVAPLTVPVAPLTIPMAPSMVPVAPLTIPMAPSTVPVAPSLPVPQLPVPVRKVRTPPGFERNNGIRPQTFAPGYVQPFNNYQMEPQFYPPRFPGQQFPGYAPPPPPQFAYGMMPPVRYPNYPQMQLNNFGNYMTSTIHSVVGQPFLQNGAPIMGPCGFNRPQN